MAASFASVYEDLTDPVSDFRVLRLHAGQHDEPIDCTLATVSRSKSPLYSALSYTWGSGTDRKTIIIGGQSVNVTPNCESALRHIRRKDATVTLWVDAICINQNDNKEKSAQIGQMREVYKAAANVIVWLGDASTDTGLAIDLLAQIGEIGRYDPQISTSRNVGTAAAWRAVEELFKREWFDRIWVIQEVSLARSVDIRCGQHEMSWTTFNRALQWYLEDNTHIRRGILDADSLFMNAIEVRNAWAARIYGTGCEPELESLLAQFSHWKATVLDDKVNGLLGMSQEHDVPELQPNYDNSVYQTYINVVRYLITRDKRLDILGQVQNPAMYKGDPPKHDKPLPSWVPDWTPDKAYRTQLSERYRPDDDAQVMTTSDGKILIPAGLHLPKSGYGTWLQDSMVREEMNFKASRDTLAESYFPTLADDGPEFFRQRGPQFDPEGTMRLKGIEVDTIHSVTQPLFRVKEDLDDPTFFLEWEKFAILQMPPGADCPYGGSFEDRLNAFWRTITTDRIYEVRSNLRAKPVCRQLFEQWRANLVRNANPADAYNPDTWGTVDSNDVHALARVLYNSMAGLDLSANGPSAADPGLLRDYEAWKQRISQLEVPTNSASTTTSPLGLQEEFTLPNFERTLRCWAYARKLARTESGRLALVPEHARPGDKVFVLYGGSVPYVLRPLPGRAKIRGYTVDNDGVRGPVGATYVVASPMHQFVGEAYVHGIMDGEAMEYPASIKRTARIRLVEQRFSHSRGTAELEGMDRVMAYKRVLDPLTSEHKELVGAWKQWLKREKEQEVWFDHATSDKL